MAFLEKLTTTEPAQGEFTREQLLVVAKAEPEVLVDLVLALQVQMRVLQQEVRELKERLALNSRNSRLRPSTGSRTYVSKLGPSRWEKHAGK